MVAPFFFYLAGVIVLTALLVVGFRNPIYSAMSLMVLFLHVAGLYLILNAEFLAAIQIIVYAGAILVLYLFVVMLLNLKEDERFGWKAFGGIAVGLLVFAELSLIFFRSHFSGLTGDYPIERIQAMGQTQAIGTVLYTQYLLPFEIASLILLAAMIGAIVLAKKGVVKEN
jgi:NADH-quinone oxidoreductase subunit J